MHLSFGFVAQAQENSSGTEEICETIIIGEVHHIEPNGVVVYQDCTYFKDCKTDEEVKPRSCETPYTCVPYVEEVGEEGEEGEEGGGSTINRTERILISSDEHCAYYNVRTWQEYVNGGIVPGSESETSENDCANYVDTNDPCDIMSASYNPGACEGGSPNGPGGTPGGGGNNPPNNPGGTTSYPSASYLIQLLNITGFTDKQYLMENVDVADALKGIFDDGGETSENIEFVTWAFEYLRANPDELEAPGPTPADLLKIVKIIRNYDSSLFGLIPGAGPYIDGIVRSPKSNFKYAAWWRLAHNKPASSYTGALGITGEALAGFLEHSYFNNPLAVGLSYEKAKVSFGPPYIGMAGTWDFKMQFTAKMYVVPAEGCNYDDGTPYQVPHPRNPGEKLDLYYEVKTISSNNTAETILTYIKAGITQAVQNKQQNPAVGTNIVRSILYFDKDAYMKAYLAYPSEVSLEYMRLFNGGASLHLKQGLLSDTKVAVDKILLDIKNETSN